MARFELRPIGVYDKINSRHVIPQSGEFWQEYLIWIRDGNVCDPHVPPPAIAEDLAGAKARRRQQVKLDGLQRMRTRLDALRTFDDVQLLREVVLSIAPAARQLTAKLQYCADTYAAGMAAIDAVNAATTISQVDSVVPVWPAL